MFDKEFYPTPISLVNRICGKLKGRSYGRILDPSAGKGDLLFPICEKFDASAYAIERSLELCSILRDGDIQATVLGHDWFQYKGEHYFDLIVMNPPFSNAKDHFLKALQLYPESDIVCVLPGKKSDYYGTAKGKIILESIDDVAEYEEYNGAFSGVDAERKTNVDVTVVYVLRDQSTEERRVFNFSPDGDRDVSFDCVDQQKGLVKRDIVAQLVKNYRDSLDAFKVMVEARKKLVSACGSMVGGPYSLDDLIKRAFNCSENMFDQYNHFVDGLKEASWQSLFIEGKFNSFMTEKVKRDFDKFAKENGALSFSEENIQNVLMSLFENSHAILKQNVENVFDLLTKYYDDNRLHVEGWKTNDRWKVKKKFILPWVVQPWGGYRDNWMLGYNIEQSLHDIDVAMCSLTGKHMEDIITLKTAINRRCGWGEKGEFGMAESEFFTVKCYKKGTGHFTFKDEDLWNVFNLEACGLKKWLAE